MFNLVDLEGHEVLLLEHKNGDIYPQYIALLSNSRINKKFRVRMILNEKGEVFDTEMSYTTIESYIADGTLVQIIG